MKENKITLSKGDCLNEPVTVGRQCERFKRLMPREDGYYWVKVKESVSDKGGPCCDEWIIELWDCGKWQCWYAEVDSAFQEIDERRIERGEQ